MLGPAMAMNYRRTGLYVPPDGISFDEMAACYEPCPRENLCYLQPIWRYQSIDKFLDLLRTSRLYMARLDKFNDKLEGLWSQGNFHRRTTQWEAFHAGYKINENVTEMALQRFPMRERCFAICWHINDAENREMWRRYVPDHESVAIKSRAGALQFYEAVLEGVTGKVAYVGHEDPRPEFISWAPAFFKPLEFRFEREFRLAWPWPHHYRQPPEFVKPQIQLRYLIEEVIVHPNASSTFFRFVQGRVARYVPSAVVSRSKLSGLW